MKVLTCIVALSAMLLLSGCGGGSGVALADDPDVKTIVREALLTIEDMDGNWCCEDPNRVTQIDDVCGHVHNDTVVLFREGDDGQRIGGFAEIIQVYPKGEGKACMRQLRDAIGDDAMEFPRQADETLAQRIDRANGAIHSVYMRRDDAVISLIVGPLSDASDTSSAEAYARLALEKFDRVVGEHTDPGS